MGSFSETFETGQNLLPVLRIVTRTVHAACKKKPLMQTCDQGFYF